MFPIKNLMNLSHKIMITSFQCMSKYAFKHDFIPRHIIIGAGSAGCVLADRLTENNKNNNVLLIEAGPKDYWWNWKIHMPAALMYNLCNDKYNWYYNTIPQKNLNNRRIYWPRGRLWGGSSSINAMCYVRGHPQDYDRWEQQGAKGWDYLGCLPYFKKAQTHELSKGPEDIFRGYNGPLHVKQGDCSNELHQAFFNAGKQMGWKILDDQNGIENEGLSKMDMTIKNGERHSVSKAYLWNAVKRDNLNVLSNTIVLKIIMEKKKAIGVRVMNRRTKEINDIYCEDSIILSGGAINTPQLLLLSGIGPEEHLRDVNVPLIHELPGVGSTLQDHLEIYVQQKCKKPITLYNKSSWKFPHNMIKSGLQWFLSKKGLCASSHLESGGFIKSSTDKNHSDIQLHFLPSTVHEDGRKNGKCHGYQVHIGPMRSKSIGSIRLSDNNPLNHPIIDPNYMSEVDDWKEFRQCVRLARELFKQKAFDEYRDIEMAPGDDVQSDEDIDNFIRHKTASAYHASCSCKMGDKNDPFNVVDAETMNVIGLEGLKIVDASVMPSIISANLNATVVMIAEKASDIILGKKALRSNRNVYEKN
uniref:Choline dehydrogenase n=1 Tax=Parastrongyloides trichosuri TaxID=131310 RepID=A0A0N4ZBD1_PARTI